MKKIGLFLMWITGICLVPFYSNAQFSGKANKSITECDCNSKLDELNVSIAVPDLSGYDYVVFRVKRNDNVSLGSQTFYVKTMEKKSNITFNLLNPEHTATSRPLLGGKESRLFEGKDMSMSYNSLCEDINKDMELYLEVIGIRQVGEKITYEVSNRNTGEITGIKRSIYDNGTVLYKTESLKVKGRKNLKEGRYKFGEYATYFGSIGVGILTYIVTGKPYK